MYSMFERDEEVLLQVVEIFLVHLLVEFLSAKETATFAGGSKIPFRATQPTNMIQTPNATSNMFAARMKKSNQKCVCVGA